MPARYSRGQGLSHFSDRRYFSVSRIPLRPAHQPSAPREGAFFQLAVIVIPAAAHKFSKALSTGSGTACHGPKQSSKGGGLENQPRRDAEKVQSGKQKS